MSTMLESYQGPREIQPESLWPGLVMGGSALRSWQTARDRNQLGRHAMSQDNMWLPGMASSKQDLEALKCRAESLPDHRAQQGLAHIALNESGCWIHSEAGYQDLGASANLDLLPNLAQLEASARPLEDMSVDRRHQIAMCDTPSCQYPRHFDITYSVPSDRRALLYPNLALFSDRGEAGVQTAWGNSLPPVSYSRRTLHKFQQACSPYAPPDQTLLTAGGVAQISLLPTTGCWFVRSYYMTPVNVAEYENWQYDGYGRLRVPGYLSRTYSDFPSYATLAHRVTWLLSGRTLQKGKVLNHLCGFRPCANPDHIEQVTTRANNEHGFSIKRAVQEVLASRQEQGH